MNKIGLILVLFFSVACSTNSVKTGDAEIIEPDTTSSQKPNILFIIADDMGLDAAPGYAIGANKPHMPTINSIIDNGILFNNFWVNPACTPTRASILTGKYGFRTNVTEVGDHLATSEVSLQKYISDNSSYKSAVIGKWHLSSDTNHPATMGIDYFAGFFGGGVSSYTDWNFTLNGQTTKSEEYTTSKFTDLSIGWIKNQTSPWFLWLAYNAPHTPFHFPPENLHHQGVLPTDEASIDANPLPYYLAMLEAMDTEIGRLLGALSQEEKDNTIIIFIGDNGTPNAVTQEFSSKRSKGSVYKGGINVPMYISGYGVSRIHEQEDALINGTDLYSTIANIAGVNIPNINDSKSFYSLLSGENNNAREYIYAEIGEGITETDYTIRNQTHKYIKFNNGNEALFDLSINPMENPNLLNANRLPLSTENENMKTELVTKLLEIRE